MTFIGDIPDHGGQRSIIERAHRVDEARAVSRLLAAAQFAADAESRIHATAFSLVSEIRRRGADAGGIDAFLHEYELSTKEGVILMCLAEALLRIPDAETADALIADKLGDADWAKHLGHSASLFVNASTWALMLTGRVIDIDDHEAGDVGSLMRRLVKRSGEPVIRQAMLQAMRIMGRQFVMGRDIGEALDRARPNEDKGYRYSYDMLGESARTEADAQRYLKAYSDAISAVGKAAKGRGIDDAPGISVKLSALHPRYELAKRDRVIGEVLPRLRQLAKEASAAKVGFCVDAEEADRLDISLDLIDAVAGDPALAGWNGFGLALQTYQKRAFDVTDWLIEAARRHKRRLNVRLVKGAYWDTEIKRAQEQGLDGYPVFTRKVNTDLSYIACAGKLLAAPDAVYPQFATHNAQTVATILELAGANRQFEFQRLHGMGVPLYDQVVGSQDIDVPCRVYAPVGTHEDLLAYLVRRLLENGANTSFVNRIVDEDAPVGELIAPPWRVAAEIMPKAHPKIPLPAGIYGPDRRNAAGVDLGDPSALRGLADAMRPFADIVWKAAPAGGGKARDVYAPHDRNRKIGEVVDASPADIENALAKSERAQPAWDAMPADERSRILGHAADLIEENTPELLALCVQEGGKTVADTVPEIREAVDFLRYYGHRAALEFQTPEPMPGPTGETNLLSLHGRGVFACISPWNFPVAIFCGQISAALAAGNAVVAKPAEQTPLAAARVVELLHAAGVPVDVLHLLAGDGPSVGAPLVADPRISGVAFTGSTDVARAINRSLAGRNGPIVPLIAETGGQNAMIADSTSLPEQVVADAVFSAFRSAGQRCSALRVLFLQEDIADKVIEMLAGATEELSVGDPALLSTDVGPVIDQDALDGLRAHAAKMDKQAKLICQARLDPGLPKGYYFQPRAYEIDNIHVLEREVFGPIMHVVRYRARDLDKIVDAINGTGYGLTLGIHSRVDGTHRRIVGRAKVGNTYINRNQIGAVVGVQPFGGEGLSGTGPKAGGPRYLYRFAVERSVSVNTTAAGGNAALMSLTDTD